MGTSETRLYLPFMGPDRRLHSPEAHILTFALAHAGCVLCVTYFLEPCFLAGRQYSLPHRVAESVLSAWLMVHTLPTVATVTAHRTF